MALDLSMRNPAAQGKCDSNQSELTAVYESLFVQVTDTHTQGAGFPDAIVSCSGMWDAVEFKTAGGTPTPAQERFMRDAKAKVTIVRNQDDVISHVQKMRAKQAGVGT